LTFSFLFPIEKQITEPPENMPAGCPAFQTAERIRLASVSRLEEIQEKMHQQQAKIDALSSGGEFKSTVEDYLKSAKLVEDAYASAAENTKI